MLSDQCYEKTPLNTVKRYRNRGKYNYKEVHGIIDKTRILHVSFPPGETGIDEGSQAYPVILPMLGCTGDFSSREEGTDKSRAIYFHGYISARIMRGASTSGGTYEDNDMPVCVAATLLDGVVLALTPNHHSCNYRSAVAFGRAQVVTNEAERLWAMELITENLVPGRWAATRYPSAAEQQSTGILRVDIDSASAKVRTGTTGEDRRDLRDEEMRQRVWAGVVPTHMVWDSPVSAPTNVMKHVPRYIDE